MSVQCCFYTVYGVKLPWNEELFYDYDEVYEKLSVDVIIDGMCSEYIVLGHILFNSGDIHRDGPAEVTEHSIIGLPSLKSEYIKEFEKYLPQHSHLLSQEWKIISFAHFY